MRPPVPSQCGLVACINAAATCDVQYTCRIFAVRYSAQRVSSTAIRVHSEAANATSPPLVCQRIQQQHSCGRKRVLVSRLITMQRRASVAKSEVTLSYHCVRRLLSARAEFNVALMTRRSLSSGTLLLCHLATRHSRRQVSKSHRTGPGVRTMCSPLKPNQSTSLRSTSNKRVD